MQVGLCYLQPIYYFGYDSVSNHLYLSLDFFQWEKYYYFS